MKKFFTPLFMIIIAFAFLWGCNNNSTQDKTDVNPPKNMNKTAVQKEKASEAEIESGAPKITFIELGSVNCIPCRMMQPVMKSVEEKYGDQIKVVFYDVWKPEQKHYAQQYGIRVIPTQVFLNSNGDEIFRHEGYFPEEELDEFLQTSDLKIQSNSQGN